MSSRRKAEADLLQHQWEQHTPQNHTSPDAPKPTSFADMMANPWQAITEVATRVVAVASSASVRTTYGHENPGAKSGLKIPRGWGQHQLRQARQLFDALGGGVAGRLGDLAISQV